MTQPTKRASYRTPRNVVLFLEWSESTSTWEESCATLGEYSQGTLHTYRISSRNSYITFAGIEPRIRREWPLTTDVSRINKNACGVPTDTILSTIPYDILTEFDNLLLSHRRGSPIRFPSAAVKECWEKLTGEGTKKKTKPETKTNPLPKHVQDILLADAVRTQKECAIAMEPITFANGSVTSCGHVFTKDALHHWLHTNKNCPECRANL